MTSSEARFIAALRTLATAPGARSLMDDAAVLELGGASLVLTKDMLVEGVHYRPDDPPADVAWKLVAVNLSDLAAKAARPAAAMLGYMLGQEEWDQAFVAGLRSALDGFSLPLLGGDTVSGPDSAPRVLSLTVIGAATGPVPDRAGARPGDELWVSGSIGDGGAGLAMLDGDLPPDEALIRRYRAPRPRLEAGQALGPIVSAMMDVSDGLLIDARRMAEASGVAIEIALDRLPLSSGYRAALGEDRRARLRAATAGDDYELLFAAPADAGDAIVDLGDNLGLKFSRVGHVKNGRDLMISDADGPVSLPPRLGYQHDHKGS